MSQRCQKVRPPDTRMCFGRKTMGKKKVEHVVFDGMRKIKKKVNINDYNKRTNLKNKKVR